MSWNGTVRCSHCYTTGHNKRSCPNITQETLDRYQSWKRQRELAASNDDTDGVAMLDGYIERERAQYVKRTGLDPDTGEKIKRKVAKAERMKNVQCGYCSGIGHTRRVCGAVKADYRVYLVETKQVRKDLLTAVQEAGIGVGSMVPFPDHGYNVDGKWGTYTALNYITTYHWDSVDAHNRGLGVGYVNHKNIHRMHSPYHCESITFERLVERMKEVSEDAPAPSLAGSINPPGGWLDSGRSLKEAFPTTGNRHDKERPYEYRWPSDSRKEVITSLGLEEHYPNMDRS
jgi:hypothetical protein